MEDKELLRARIIKRCRYIVCECDQAIVDAEYWNGLNEHVAPIDIEDFRVNRSWALKVLKQIGETP